MKRKFLRILTYIIAFTTLMLQISTPIAYALEDDGKIYEASNNFIKFHVNKENGRFTIKTNQGDPYKGTKDANKDLLFEDEYPDTSFTTFKIDGEEYIYGNSYGFLNLSGNDFDTTVNGTTSESIWNINKLEIKQILTINNNPDDLKAGRVKISYEVTNKGENSKNVGSRILLDTKVANDDGTDIICDFTQYSKEKELTGDEIPTIWRTEDDKSIVEAFGFIDGWGNTAPNKMIVGHYEGLSNTKWDYKVNEDLDFTSNNNKYGGADSAVALYWENVAIAAGETKVFETYYGLGEFLEKHEGLEFPLSISAPNKLTVNSSKTDYVDKIFDITCTLNNNTMKEYTDVTLNLVIPEGSGLSLVDGEKSERIIQKLGGFEKREIKFKVQAKAEDHMQVFNYRLEVQTYGMKTPKYFKKAIIAPGLKKEMPEMHFKSVAPGTIYIEGARNFTIQGEGLNALANKDEWYMMLVDKYSSKVYSIKDESIKVSNNAIQVSLTSEEESIPVGVYNVGIYGLPDSNGIILPHEIEVSDDVRYRLEEYGILSIVKTVPVSKDSGATDFIYNVELFENEDDLKAFENNIKQQNTEAKALYEAGNETEFKQLLVTVRGNVTEYKKDGERKFYIESDGKEDININQGISYVGDDLCIVEKNQNDVSITGYGVLGLVGSFDFWKWGFDIELENGEDYSLNALSSDDIQQYFNQDDENKKELVEENIEYLYMRDKISDAQQDVLFDFLGGGTVINKIFGFHVQINDAVLKEEGISFGGIMALSFLSRSGDDFKDREFENSIEVEEALYEKNSSGKTVFKGINASGNISLPTEAFSGILSNGSLASVTINSIEKVYGLDFDADIKVIELSGHISIAFKKSKPVLDDLELMLATPDIKLGPYITITSLGGGINNLYTVLTEDGKTGPPLTIMAAAGFNLIAENIFEGMLRSEFTKYGVKFHGSLELVPINSKVLKEAWFELRWAEPMYISAGANIDLKQVVVADLSLYISGKHFEGSAHGDVKVPRDWPIIGGRTLFGMDLGVNSKNLWAAICVDLGLVDPKVGFSYKWKNHDFDVNAKWTKLDSEDEEPENYVYKEVIDMGADQEDMIVYVGTNIKKLGSSEEPLMYGSLDNDFMEPKVYALADDTQHYFNVYNQNMAVFEIEYKGEVPTFELFDPTDKKEVLEQGEDKAYLIQENFEGTGGKVYIFVDKPLDGTWKLQISKSAQTVFYNLETPPSLQSVQASKVNDRQVEVQWTAADSEGGSIDIFIAKDKKEAGILVEGDIEGNDKGTYIFDVPSGITADDYYIRVVIKEGEFGYQSMYTDNAIYLVDNDAPSIVTNAKLSPGGNGTLLVDYNEASGTYIQGYYVELLDDSGKKVDNIGKAFIEQGNEKAIVIGGTYEAVIPVITDEGKASLDSDGNPITEKVEIVLPTGQSYKAAITTVSEKNGMVHYSPVVYSNEVFLNEPNPPEIEVELLNATTDGEDDRGENIKVIKYSIAKIHFKADQEVTTIVLVNGIKHTTLNENNTVIDVPLKDGENDVKFICENEGLDRTTEEMTFKVDSIAPILKIGEIKEQNNQVVISGFTEPDVDLRINGQTALIGDRGDFHHTLAMENKLIKSVRIESTDGANNQSVYETEVQNDSIGKIESVHISPSPKALKEGSSYDLQLVARDDSGKEVIINNSLVNWSLLEGNEFAELTDEGVLKADNEGQIIIQAKYLIASDYALEDALVLDITKDGTTSPEQPGGEDNNNTGGSSSGSSHNKKTKDKLKQLEDILNDVIARENNLIPVITERIKAGEGISLKADDVVVVTLDKGTLSEEDNMLLIAKLQNPKIYMDNLLKDQFVTDIYEIQLAKSNHNLKKPVKLTFKVDKNKANDDLAVYFYNEKYDSWEYIGGNISGDKITVEVQHFSKYAVINNEAVLSMADIKSRWSEDSVKKLTSLGIVNGLEKDGIRYFEPKRSISRLELAAMVTRVMNDIELNKKDNPPFADWSSIADWGKDYARAAYNNGWIKGRDTKDQGLLFAGDEKATRAEVATIIGRLLKDESSKDVTFTDNKEIPSWAKPYIDRLVKADILSGYPDGTFRPNQAITREEVAKILSNYIEKVVNK